MPRVGKLLRGVSSLLIPEDSSSLRVGFVLTVSELGKLFDCASVVLSGNGYGMLPVVVRCPPESPTDP